VKFELLKKLVSINTINDKNNNEFIQYIKDYLEIIDFKVKIIRNKNKLCLIAKSHKECNLCFLGHSDTVNISDSWSIDPLKLKIENKYLYGLGVCDMKGGIACFLESLKRIDLKSLKKGIMIIITYDEEIGFEGIKTIEKFKSDIPENVIIGEPTDLEPVTSCKGCMEFKIKIKGKAAHSSYLTKGINSIEIANSFINDLLKYSKEIKKEKNNNFDIPYTTMNIAKINAGCAINVVPSICCLEFDFRTIESSQHERILNEIDRLSKKYNCFYECYTNVLPSINKSIEDIDFYKKITSKESKSCNFVTEGNFLEKKNLIILGPGPVTAHESNEHISIDSYKKTAKIYIDIINKYCK